MYRIAGWVGRYEVNSKGRIYREGDDPRINPLGYIRASVHGHDEGRGWKKLKHLAGDSAPEVFGLFLKFLEIAGDNHWPNRGVLRECRDGEPATADDLAITLGISEQKIQQALDILVNPVIAWLIKTYDSPGNSRILPDSPGKQVQTKAKGRREVEEKKGETPGDSRNCPGTIQPDSESTDSLGKNSNTALALGKEARAAYLHDQLKAIAFTDKIKRVFEYLDSNESTTFANIRRHLLKVGKIEQGIDWLSEILAWGSRNNKDQLDMKKCFVAKIKRETGFEKKERFL